MTIMKYKSGSPYYYTPQTSWYLENIKLRDLQNDPTDKFVQITSNYEFRPYNLSYELYGNPDYWWVFMVLNPDLIKDPIYDFTTGKRIRIPTKERIFSIVS